MRAILYGTLPAKICLIAETYLDRVSVEEILRTAKMKVVAAKTLEGETRWDCVNLEVDHDNDEA